MAPVSLAPRVMGTVEPGRMLPMHLVKLGANTMWPETPTDVCGFVNRRRKKQDRMGIKLGGRPELHRQSPFRVHFHNQRILKVIFCPDFIASPACPLPTPGPLWSLTSKGVLHELDRHFHTHLLSGMLQA